MLTLTVVNGPGAPALSARFDELGGTIGRADSNLLVLPDPGRTISRVHAQVVYRRGGYLLVDRGSNPVMLNGEPLSGGSSRELAQDDRVQLGAYTLRVDLRDPQAASPDAEAPTVLDLNGRGGRGGSVVPAPALGAAMAPAPAASAAVSGSASTPASTVASMAAIDPFAAFGDWDDAADDPLGLGLAPTPRGRSGQYGGGCDDGLISAEPRPSAPAPMALSMAHVGLDSDARPERHALESMFGIDETGPLGDPLAASFGDPLGDPLGDITTADAHADDWRQAFQPKAAPSPAPTMPPMAPLARGPLMAPLAHLPAMAPLAHVPAASLGPSSVPDLAETVLRPAAPAPAASASDDVAAALAQGLGLPRDQLPVLTPALAGLIGELLRDAVAGTVDMLLARATLKREVQAAATMIATRDNNPLKFSPNVDVALRHLLQPAVSGFLAPRAAMRDAFDDLRAHQVGLVAGIQGASSRVLRRLDPERMAERLRAPSLVDRALPMARKAALWERFVDEYDRLGQDAHEAFQAAFAQAFRAAYEEHFETLRQAGR